MILKKTLRLIKKNIAMWNNELGYQTLFSMNLCGEFFHDVIIINFYVTVPRIIQLKTLNNISFSKSACGNALAPTPLLLISNSLKVVTIWLTFRIG